MCGGTPRRALRMSGREGLSPRVRGNRRRRSSGRAITGSIPACAGEPVSLPPAPARPWVYPRVCGGTLSMNSGTRRCIGLSPRVRGNPPGVWHDLTAPGSIPACAGEPGQLPLVLHRAEVYPRVCGGTLRSSAMHTLRYGLSPRVRGNHSISAVNHPIHRSIPACAGEPIILLGAIGVGAVYPRVCGGTAGASRPRLRRTGLSPRVRGNLSCCSASDCTGRSIPACAGEPTPSLPKWRCTRVYPRVCGGTTSGKKSQGILPGLSPRVRGNPAEGGWQALQSRSIPACAGEPDSPYENAGCS